MIITNTCWLGASGLVGWPPVCACACVYMCACVRACVCERLGVGVRTWLPASVCVCVRARAPLLARLEVSPGEVGSMWGGRGRGGAYIPTQTSFLKSISFASVTHYLGTGSCLLWLTSQHLMWVPFLHRPFGQNTASVCFGAMKEQVRNRQSVSRWAPLRFGLGLVWHVVLPGHPSVKLSGPLRYTKIWKLILDILLCYIY